MKILMLLFFMGLQETGAVTHSLKYFYTGSSGIPNFPEFVTVGMVDDLPIDHYDSITARAQIKQDWMKKVIADDPEYLDRNTQTYMGNQPSFKAGIEILRQRFNQSKGVHLYQYMYGCEWDDESQQVTGYRQYGYDGEDFVIWSTESNTWIAPKQHGVITTNKWNGDKGQLEYYKNYLDQICPDWLKKYVEYGRSSLMRTDLPSVSFLQKSSSSPVSCFATGFYPNGAEMFWRKNGEEIHDGVEKGEIKLNNDGTFQMSVDIDLSSVPTEDWPKYECVFQLSGVETDISQKLEKTRILTNESNFHIKIGIAVGIVLGVFLLGGVAFGLKRKLCPKQNPTPINTPEVTEIMIPQDNGQQSSIDAVNG